MGLRSAGPRAPRPLTQVLELLQREVLSRRPALPAAAQACAFSDAALEQLALIVAAAPGPDAEEGQPIAGGGAAEAAESAGSAAAAAAAEAVLTAVTADPAHGLCCPESAGAFSLAEAGSHALERGQRRLLRLLLRLHPADAPAHFRLLVAATGADGAVGAAALLALPWQLEPSPAGRWFVHAAALGRMLQLLAAQAQPGLRQRAERCAHAQPTSTLLHAAPVHRGCLADMRTVVCRGAAPPAPDSRQQQALLRCCLPPCLNRAALGRGLQHSNALVRVWPCSLWVSQLLRRAACQG